MRNILGFATAMMFLIMVWAWFFHSSGTKHHHEPLSQHSEQHK